MVFMSTCNSVKFHSELLNYIDIPVKDIHGRQKQNKRTSTFIEFCSADSGVLICTDVAARGLDIPEVDWIVQYDPPDDPKVVLSSMACFYARNLLFVRNTFIELAVQLELAAEAMLCCF